MVDSDKNGSNYCQNEDCPSPQVLHSKDSYVKLKNKVYCLFCLARTKAKVSASTWEPKPIKTTNQDSIVRIPLQKTPTKDFKQLASSERIPPQINKNDQKTDIEHVKTILSILEKKFNQNFGVISYIKNISHFDQSIIVKTDVFAFLFRVILFQKPPLNELFNQIMENINNTKINDFQVQLSKCPIYIHNWLKSKWNIEDESLENVLLSFSELTGKIIPIESLNEENYDLDFLEQVSKSYGMYVYECWTLGNNSLIQSIITFESSLNLVSIWPLKQYLPISPFKFDILDKFIQKIPSNMPFLLDIECKEAFLDGTIEAKRKLISLLKNELTKDLMTELIGMDSDIYADPDKWPEINF